MAETRNPAPPEVWRTPECPFAIEYDPELLEDLRKLAVNAYHALPHGGTEIGGVLFGSREKGQDSEILRLRAFRPVECQYAFGPSYILSEKDRAGLAKLLESALFDPELDSLVPLGWYHTHTRSEIFLSDKDLEIHNHFFPESWQVALVIRPHTLEPSRAGFFFREGNGEIRSEKCYREISLRPKRRKAAARPEDAGDRADGEPPQPVQPLEAPPEPQIDLRPQLVTPPRFSTARDDPPRQKSPSFPWMVVFLAVLATLSVAGIAGFVGFWAATRSHAAVSPGPPTLPPALHLRVTESDGQLQIQWDRAAEPVRAAQSAYLEIVDGDAKSVILLDPARLRGGAFTYARQAEHVFIHMILQQPEGRTVQEGTGFVGKLAAAKPEAGPSEAEAALKDQNAALRQQLDEQRRRVKDLNREVEIQRQLLRRK